jgi:Zn-dependent M28 family amino/carboxypeptidase
MFESINAPTRPNWLLRIAFAAVVVALGMVFVSLWRMTQMPLRSYKGLLSPLSAAQSDLASRLTAHVRYMSETIGERSLHRAGSLPETTDYLHSQLVKAGYAVAENSYTVEGQSVSNLEVDLIGSEAAKGAIVVGAHYDSVTGTVGANDNASGVAATLELARLLKGSHLRRTIRLVFFVNEEPPYFQTERMGSLVYAKQLRNTGTPISAMISLETIGYYSDAPESQKYPAILSLFYPNRGNFISFVGNSESRDLVRQATRNFREYAQFPSEGVAAPASLPGVGWSDQWSFWQQKYPAIMITDTAVFRYPYYHTALDTTDKVDFDKMARVVDGVRSVVLSLADQR